MDLIYEPKGRAREYAALACNIYKGCQHQCVYCVTGDTLIFRSDFSAIPISKLSIGDRIVGLVKTRGRTNTIKFTETTVENIWTTVKPVYEVILENGMAARCSGDHRWLTDRGWKYVTGTMAGEGQRPYLTTNNLVRTVAAPITTPVVTEDYMRGYLSGIVRGDGHLAKHQGNGRFTRHYERRNPGNSYMRLDKQYQFRLCLKDREPLERTKAYLDHFGIGVSEFQFTDTMMGIRNYSQSAYHGITNLISWSDSPEYRRGFLAGIYDAEGSRERKHHNVRISNNDPEILAFIEQSLDCWKIPHVQDQPHQAPGGAVHYVRIRGGRDSAIRFWAQTDPAMFRKRNLEGHALNDNSRVVSIKELGYSELMFDITTGTGNFVANGMVSHNCYAPNAVRRERARFADAERRTGFIDQLAKDVAKAQASGKTGQVHLCFTTDAYQPLALECTDTQDTIKTLHEHGFSVAVLTKGGTRALRDLDLFTPADAFAVTLTCASDAMSREWEPGAALPADRMEALCQFHDAGIPTWVSLEPVLEPRVSLSLIQATHDFVDGYKVGKLNYHPRAREIDWGAFGHAAIQLLQSYGFYPGGSRWYYIKDDLQGYL